MSGTKTCGTCGGTGQEKWEDAGGTEMVACGTCGGSGSVPK